MEIKGTKDGILVSLEDQDWLEAKGELVEQIANRHDFFQGAQLILDVGNNVLRGQGPGRIAGYALGPGRDFIGYIQSFDCDLGNGSIIGLEVIGGLTSGKAFKKAQAAGYGASR